MKDLKKLVADDNLRVELHDRIGHNLKKLLDAFDGEQFSNEEKYSPEEFKTRIEKCEELTEELCKTQALLGYWGTINQSNLYTFSIENIAAALRGSRDNNIWKAVKWHSVRLLFYHGGISAIASKNYQKLFRLFDLKVPPPDHLQKMVSVGEALLIVNSRIDNIYNKLIETDNHKTPLSEYLYQRINMTLNDVIYLGPLFEPCFDKFEIMYALDYIDREHDEIPERVWGPIGRFGFKVYEDNPFRHLVEEAEKLKENWQPLQAGLFGGSYERFQKICTSFQERLQRFRW